MVPELVEEITSLLLKLGAPIQYVSEQMGHQEHPAHREVIPAPGGSSEPPLVAETARATPTKSQRVVATSGNLEAKMKKAADDGSQVVDFRAGHGIRTRDFDLWQIGGQLKTTAHTVHAVHFWSMNSPVIENPRIFRQRLKEKGVTERLTHILCHVFGLSSLRQHSQ